MLLDFDLTSCILHRSIGFLIAHAWRVQLRGPGGESFIVENRFVHLGQGNASWAGLPQIVLQSESRRSRDCAISHSPGWLAYAQAFMISPMNTSPKNERVLHKTIESRNGKPRQGNAFSMRFALQVFSTRHRDFGGAWRFLDYHRARWRLTKTPS